MKFKINSHAPVEGYGMIIREIEEGAIIIEAEQLPEPLEPYLLSTNCCSKDTYSRVSIECRPYRRSL